MKRLAIKFALRKTIVITIIFVALFAYMVSIASAAPNEPPDESWTKLPVNAVKDCSGEFAQTNDASGTGDAKDCQEYDDDLYESLDYTNKGPGSADIVKMLFAGDDDYIYVQWKMAADWDIDDSASHNYYVEIDVDPDTENNPGPRGDYYIRVVFKGSCNNGSFTDSSGGAGGDGYERAKDTNDTVGGDTIPGSDFDSDDTGYDTGDSASGRVWCRIKGGKPQAAILRSYIGLSDTATNVRMRGQISQTSNIDKGKMYWNDHQGPKDLENEDFDNTE